MHVVLAARMIHYPSNPTCVVWYSKPLGAIPYYRSFHLNSGEYYQNTYCLSNKYSLSNEYSVSNEYSGFSVFSIDGLHNYTITLFDK